MGKNAGAAYVFTRNGEFWQQQQKLVGIDTDSHDRFGFSTSVSGDVAVIGAPGAEDYAMDENQYVKPGSSELRYFEGLYEPRRYPTTAVRSKRAATTS